MGFKVCAIYVRAWTLTLAGFIDQRLSISLIDNDKHSNDDNASAYGPIPHHRAGVVE